MNVRFAESCRPSPLTLEDTEQKVRTYSLRDGRTEQQLALSCDKDIFIGIFFDGTNNNKYRDTPGHGHSNVARLYEVFPGTHATQTLPTFRSVPKKDIPPDTPYLPAAIPASDRPYYRKIYVPGLGTPHPDILDSGQGTEKTLGLSTAYHGQERLDWALLQFVNQVHAAIFSAPLEPVVKLDSLFKAQTGSAGSSPAKAEDSASARLSTFVRQNTKAYLRSDFEALLDSYRRRLDTALVPRRQNKPKLRKIRLSVFGFSRGATKARAFVNLLQQLVGHDLCGISIQVDFLGVFDTVASVGLPHGVPPLAGMANDGHWAWAKEDALTVPDHVRRCVHLVAAHEVRGSFPLDSVCKGAHLPSNCKEIVYPGVHSDVGGGYPPEDQGRCLGQGAVGDALKLSQIPLAQMLREARMGGVPFTARDESLGWKYFAIAPQLRDNFNAYVQATRTGEVPPTLGRGEPTFAAMYPTETQPRGELHRIMRDHAAWGLAWRKWRMSQKGGASALPGMAASNRSSKHQDIEDMRGAESELLKEVQFLKDPSPDKFKVADDQVWDGVRTASDAIHLGLARFPTLRVFASVVPMGLKQPIEQVMRDKQSQWDHWLRHDWENPRPLPDAVKKLFEEHVHDSRAWFKCGLMDNSTKFAPDDEDWFTLGGREAALNERKAAATKKLQSPDPAERATASRELKELEQPGAPLIKGGREAYRLFGYLRHRHIYQSGVLNDPGYKSRQQAIEREERQREAQRRKETRIQQENAAHEQEVEKIKANNRRVQNDPGLSSSRKNEYADGARNQIKRLNDDHAQALRRLEATP